MKPVPVAPRALVVGPPAVLKPLEPVFAPSWWMLERVSTLEDALHRIEQETIPVMFCLSEDCKAFARMFRKLDRPPLLLALSDKRPVNDDWIETIAPNVHELNVNALSYSRLLPLLNYAWRTCADSLPEPAS